MAFYIVENDATSSIKVHGKAEDGEAAWSIFCAKELEPCAVWVADQHHSSPTQMQKHTNLSASQTCKVCVYRNIKYRRTEEKRREDHVSPSAIWWHRRSLCLWNAETFSSEPWPVRLRFVSRKLFAEKSIMKISTEYRSSVTLQMRGNGMALAKTRNVKKKSKRTYGTSTARN
jgi:hypothetical protein